MVGSNLRLLGPAGGTYGPAAAKKQRQAETVNANPNSCGERTTSVLLEQQDCLLCLQVSMNRAAISAIMMIVACVLLRKERTES
jgi:hypothetical protein